ncbi:nucleotide exchange factor SIL1 isoform X3 [Xiphias gladius]|uniref:nucleotide exchange factor SIL1 isoform X3 n=1 Tax=Xiphias gladius TaxID=8245 RepID=UPI001A98963B|nr:nucleotide exchange factor SIL1 isoform X3 [Xiphias gladius]
MYPGAVCLRGINQRKTGKIDIISVCVSTFGLTETVTMKLINSSARGPSFTCLTLAFLLLLQCHHIASDFGQKSDSALIVVDNVGGGEGVGGDEEEEAMVNLKVVQPIEQWQTLKPGQAVPAGSHVRLNLQTGQREVRLGEEQLKYWKQEHREREGTQSSFTPDELKQAMKKIKEDLNTIMRRLLDQLNSSNSTAEQRLNILLELEYLVHQVDNAQTLCSMGGLQFILEGLNSSDFRLQESSAFVLGSALTSNPVVQVKALESGALRMLLTILATAQPFRVKKKVLFAVASLIRHFPYAQHNFLSHGGLQVLSELFRADGGRVLQTRIVTMLYDMISQKELISQAGLDPVLDASHEERVRQYSQVSLEGELLEKGWCSLVPQLLESTEHDYREKALRALLVMAPMCLDKYRSDSSLLGSLLSLRDQYLEMVQSEMILGEENGYFAEIVELIDALQVKMK